MEGREGVLIDRIAKNLLLNRIHENLIGRLDIQNYT